MCSVGIETSCGGIRDGFIEDLIDELPPITVLLESCQCNLNAFPAEVRGMFDAWLTAELASIERQTRIVTIERALDSLVLRTKSLQDDLAGAQDSSRLLALYLGPDVTNPAFPLKASTAVVVYFDVQTRTATGPLAGVGVCAESLSPTAVAQ